MKKYLEKVAKEIIKKVSAQSPIKDKSNIRENLFGNFEDPEALKEYIRSKLGPNAEGFSQSNLSPEELRDRATSELSDGLNFENIEGLDKKLSLIHEMSSNLGGLTSKEIDADTQLALVHMLSQKSGLTPETVMLALKEEGSSSGNPLLRSIYPSDIREQVLGFSSPE